MANIVIPHFDFPFTFTAKGANVVEQDSLEEIVACVEAIVNCTEGDFPEIPTFGVPDMAFEEVPLDTEALTEAVKAWEPRADEAAVQDILTSDPTGSTIQVTMNTPGDVEPVGVFDFTGSD